MLRATSFGGLKVGWGSFTSFNTSCRWLSSVVRYTVREEALQMKAVRSSGPGGQHVNKTSSCVEVRFNVHQASWLPEEVRTRLAEQQKNRINKAGELVVTAQEERSQVLNRRLAISKLQSMVDEAAVEPKEREMWEGLGEETKLRRKEKKRYRSKIKQSRRVGKDAW